MRTCYGLRALLDIAAQRTGHPVLLEEIARRQNVTLSFLEHTVEPLIAAGVHRTTRGMFGGVTLGKEPGAIRLADVVDLLEGVVPMDDCASNPSTCVRAETCAIRRLWSELSSAVQGVLANRTVADLMADDDGTVAGSCGVAAVRPLRDAARVVGRGGNAAAGGTT